MISNRFRRCAGKILEAVSVLFVFAFIISLLVCFIFYLGSVLHNLVREDAGLPSKKVYEFICKTDNKRMVCRPAKEGKNAKQSD